MVGKPITATTFYSKKQPDVRIVIPSENNGVSEDSDCGSEDSDCGWPARQIIRSDLIVPESDHESDSEPKLKAKKTPPVKRKRKRILTTSITDRYATPKPVLKTIEPTNCEIDRYATPKTLSKTEDPIGCESSEEEDFRLKLQLSQEEIIGLDDIPSPSISPISSWLNSSHGSPDMFCDDELAQDLPPSPTTNNIVQKPFEIFASTSSRASPDMFDDELSQNMPPSTPADNVVQSPLKAIENLPFTSSIAQFFDNQRKRKNCLGRENSTRRKLHLSAETETGDGQNDMNEQPRDHSAPIPKTVPRQRGI